MSLCVFLPYSYRIVPITRGGAAVLDVSFTSSPSSSFSFMSCPFGPLFFFLKVTFNPVTLSLDLAIRSNPSLFGCLDHPTLNLCSNTHLRQDLADGRSCKKDSSRFTVFFDTINRYVRRAHSKTHCHIRTTTTINTAMTINVTLAARGIRRSLLLDESLTDDMIRCKVDDDST